MELVSGTVKGGGGAEQQQQELTEEACAMFQQGLGLVLSHWTALQLAIHNEWGGPSSQLKAQQLHADIFYWMLDSKAPRYMDEFADFLHENLLNEFCTVAKDGSIEEVGEKLITIYEECLLGNFETIRLLSSKNSISYHSIPESQQEDYQIIAEESMNLSSTTTANRDVDTMDVDDAPHDSGSEAKRDLVDSENFLSLEEEADGWQLVSSKTKRRSQNFFGNP